MELHGLLGICWCVLSGPGKLAARSYEEGWSRIDGEEQAMVADGGSWIERSGRRFGRLQEEANESQVSFWVALKNGEEDDQLRSGEIWEAEEAILVDIAMRSSVS
jgi:hypothetical protein